MEELELGLGLMPRSNDGYGPYRGHTALVTTAVLTSISGFIVVLRLFTRSLLVKYIGREDWIIIAALACSFVYLGLTLSEVHFGLGYHSYNLPREELRQQLKRLWLSFPFYNASLSLTRFSILFQYLRIFPNHSFRLACFIVMGVVGSFSIWTIVSGFLHCNPISDFWTESDSGYCLSFEGVWVFNSVMNIVTDLILLALPMYPLAQLQLPKLQKIGLMLMFSMGGLVVIISAIRVYSIYDLGRRTDMSWDSAISTCWTAAECNAAIICACLPPLRPLISHLFPKILSTDSVLHKEQKKAAASVPDVEEIYRPERRFYDFDYDLALANVKTTDSTARPFGGIEVTTEVVTEFHSAEESGRPNESRSAMETESERRLIVR